MNALSMGAALMLLAIPTHGTAACLDPAQEVGFDNEPECVQMEAITIFGTARTARDVAGGASVLTPKDLEEFETTDVARALRRVPGVSLQLEDGWALRPNISIRGTATERSSRITLMEDKVLIAPAPYAAPSAYYFPTFGRINAVEVLKGPASITQGPYTVGGAINLKSTPVPETNSGFIQGEYGSDSTWRLHGWYGGGTDVARFMIETHQWRSNGYQVIDRSNAETGLDKKDYLAKLRFKSDPASRIYQQFDLKLQYSEEDSQQSYLGLSDRDFTIDGLRRYGASVDDEIHNEHDQVMLTWHLEAQNGTALTVTAYNNNTKRAWYKTEGVDFDGSDDPQSFSRTSWSTIIAAINRGESLLELSANELQSIVDGADTAEGSIQLRDNAREYYSRGIQMVFDQTIQTGLTIHSLQAGLRYHEDEEDRLQRNDTYQQRAGHLVLNEVGLPGNAGNRIQGARAWAAYIYDRIEWNRWTLTPGLRYENIELKRVRYDTSSDKPSSRDPGNFRDSRTNKFDIWLPGLGALFEFNTSTRLIAGIHRGFATPSNATGVDPEESTNYELGVRYDRKRLGFEAMFFFNDYQNLVGVCTNSSGGNCDPGDAFNGGGVHIPGLELSFQTWFEAGEYWQIPVELVYTWMNAEFQSSFNSEFFGEVEKGDPVPYVPGQQLWASLGIQGGPWSFRVSGNYVISVCTRASCDDFEKTDSAMIFDLSAHYEINQDWELYSLVENLADETYIAGRDPYGARPNKPRTFMLGVKFAF
ncbi:MAG: TonB-dependent receptor [Proteobacteria bacterium]|nr:TonB-dependent receptor [Pseudomonadota bacterium]